MGWFIIALFFVALWLLLARRPLMQVYRARQRRARGGEPGDPGPFGDPGDAGNHGHHGGGWGSSDGGHHG
jgi:hypothetical protein